MTASTPRYHGLDALRAFAMLLGVALHGGMTYIGKYLNSAEKVVWPADPASSDLILLFIVWVHAWRMQVFFLMAGFFAHLVVQRRGMRHFLKNRVRRIFIPFLLGLLIIIPLTIAAFVYGAWRTNTLDQISGESSGGFSPMHLWFLYYLMGFYLLTAVVVLAARRHPIRAAQLSRRVDCFIHRALSSRWRVFWLALPTIPLRAALTHEEVSLFAPNLPFFAYQIAFFAFGWLLFRQPALLALLRPRRVWLTYLLLGTVVLLPLTLILGAVLTESHLFYAAAYSLLTWLLMLGFVGMFDALNTRSRAWVTYLSDAAYWVYLMHLPLVALLSYSLIALPWAALPKFFLVCILTTLLLLITYQWGVRYTWIGRLLNGPRQRALNPAQ